MRFTFQGRGCNAGYGFLMPRQFLLILLLCLVGPLFGKQALSDRGVFRIYSDGKEIGVERFEIASTAKGVRATAELQISSEGVGRMKETATLVLRNGIEPISYKRVQKSPKRGSAVLAFGPEKTTAQYRTTEGGSQRMDYFLPKNVVILDTNFFHHYTFLVRQYDFIKGGTQHMDVLVPQETAPGMVRVQHEGNDQSLRKLVVKTGQVEIQIWADEGGRLMKLTVPAAKVEVLREQK